MFARPHAVAVALILALLARPASGNAYHDAIATDDMERLEALCQKQGDPGLNERGQGGQSPLMMATLMGKTKAVEILLKAKADPSVAEQDGYTPMHGAGFQGRAEIAKLLIKHGLDPSDRHEDGYTPIHRACWGSQARHTETVEALLEGGVHPNEPTSRGQLPVQLAATAETRKVLHEWLHGRNEPKDEA